MILTYAEKLHFRFFASKGNGVYPLPLEVLYGFKPARQIPGNQKIPLVCIACTTDSCSRIEHIAIVNNFAF